MSGLFDSMWLIQFQARRGTSGNQPCKERPDWAPGCSPEERLAKAGCESELHNQIMDFCRSKGWQFLHGSMSERTHRTLGEPDFIILADGGRVLFVECKSKVGKISPTQQAFKAHAAKNGHMVHVVRSMEEFLELL